MEWATFPNNSVLYLANLQQNLPSWQNIIDTLLTVFDFITMRNILRISRNKTLLFLGSICLILVAIQTIKDISQRFEELNRTIASLKSDVNIYKRRAYYQEKEASTKLQQRIAQDILQGLGPATAKPNVNKQTNTSTFNNDHVERQPFTPNGSLSDFQSYPQKLINHHNFKYILNNKSICAGVEHLSYIIYVHTMPAHFERRRSLRETWGQANLFIDHPSRLIFFLGTTDDITQAKIKEEYQQHGDLIQEDFKDDYQNLTYKAVGALKWISTYCNQTKYVFKSDDDTYLNIFMLMNLLRGKYVDERRFIMCMWWDTMPIMKHGKSCSKWCMNNLIFPGNKFFPRYCSGAAYFLSGDIINDMYKASLTVPFFWVDDVYTTGLLTKRVKDIKWLQEENRYRYSVKAFYEEYKNGKYLNWMVTVVSKEVELWVFWYLTLNRLKQSEIDLIGSDKYVKLLKNVSEYLQNLKKN